MWYPPPFWSSGVGIPSPSLSHGLGPCPARGGGLAPGCVLGNSPHAGPGCGTCGVGSFLGSDCGPVPWNVLSWHGQASLDCVQGVQSFKYQMFQGHFPIGKKMFTYSHKYSTYRQEIVHTSNMAKISHNFTPLSRYNILSLHSTTVSIN